MSSHARSPKQQNRTTRQPPNKTKHTTLPRHLRLSHLLYSLLEEKVELHRHVPGRCTRDQCTRWYSSHSHVAQGAHDLQLHPGNPTKPTGNGSGALRKNGLCKVLDTKVDKPRTSPLCCLSVTARAGDNNNTDTTHDNIEMTSSRAAPNAKDPISSSSSAYYPMRSRTILQTPLNDYREYLFNNDHPQTDTDSLASRAS